MDKRKIILKKGQEAATHYFGEAVEAVPGEAVEVKERTAIAAVESGVFEYAPEQLEVFDAQLAKANGVQPLPDNFPMRAKLIEAKLKTIDDVRNASDEKIKEIDGIGDATLKQIREAIEQEGKK